MMKKIIFTISLIAYTIIMNMDYANAEEIYFNDEDMAVTEFETEESPDSEFIPQEDQELMDLDELLAAVASKDFSRCWDITNTKYVETGGIAIGNKSKGINKNSIYAIKVTKGKETNALLYTSGLKDSSSKTSEINSNLEHANDMTYGYDSNTGNYALFVAPLYSTKIYKINAATCSLQATYTGNAAYNRGAIAYTGSTSGNNYITRTKDTTKYHFEYINGTKFYTAKSFNVSFEKTDVPTTTMQGICVYKNHLYIAARKNSDNNHNNLIYKVTTAISNISDNATVTAERVYNLGATTAVYDSKVRQFEIESIDMVDDICYFTANINAGSEDSGKGDFTGKFTM